MRFWIGHRLPLGFRAGISIPINDFTRNRQSQPNSAQAGGDFVYVIGDGRGGVKIGSSNNPLKRIGELQVGSASKLTLIYAVATKNNATLIEYAAHDLLDRHRSGGGGDWFNIPADIAVAAISTAAFRMNEPIIAVDPAMVGQVVALAATERAGGAQPVSRMSFTAKAFILIAAAVGLLTWVEVANFNNPEGLPIFLTINTLGGLFILCVTSMVSRIRA